MREQIKYILVVAIAIFVFRFFFGKKDQSGGTSTNIPKPDETKLSYSKNEYKIIADAIEVAVFGAYGVTLPFEDDTEIGRLLMLMQTEEDVYQLILEYGERYVGVIIKEGGNLVQTINEYLDNDIKQQVNENYRNKGIKVQF